jgi:hypothetical protein
LFNNLPLLISSLIFVKETIAHDKGKPVEKQGRKAVSLRVVIDLSETVWLPNGDRRTSGLAETHERVEDVDAASSSFSAQINCQCRCLVARSVF